MDDDEAFKLSHNWLWALGLTILGLVLWAYAMSPTSLVSLRVWAGLPGFGALVVAAFNAAVIVAVLPYRLLLASDRSAGTIR